MAQPDPLVVNRDDIVQWTRRSLRHGVDPHIVDAKGLADEVAALARKWSRKPASKRPRRA